jgi:hypothetical protein
LRRLDTVEGVLRSKRRWGLALLLACDAVLLTVACISYTRDEQPPASAIRGTVAIESCDRIKRNRAYCTGTFTSDDGSIRISQVGIHTDQRNTTAKGWVDGADDTVVTPAVNPNRLDSVDLWSGIVGLLVTVGVNVFIIVKLLTDADVEFDPRDD